MLFFSGKDFKSEPLPAKDSDQTTKTQATYSSPKPSSYHKLSSSPKSHNRDRGTTHINQINVADFAKLNVKVTKPTEPSPPNHNITDYQYRVSMVKFKGASNSVPNYNEKQENIKKTVAQNDALLSNTSKVRKKDVKSMKVSRIEPIPPDRASLLVPTALPHGNKFMNLLIDDRKWDQMSNSSKSTLESTLPRLHYDSPTPFQRQGNGDDEMAGEISIAVPQLPHLIANNRTTRQPSGSKKQTENNLETSNEQHVDTNLHIEEEPTVIITNEGGTHVNKEVADGTRDGWESGYQSITPRLSVDSRSHAMMPGAALHLDIPTEHRSMTPFSSITLSTYIDQSRPSSTHLDVPSNGVDNSDSYSRKISLETRSSVSKLPAIHSRNDNYESMDDRTLYFTPLTIQSIRTPDPEISDENE
ncbi:hypothetical protein EB796_008877 [Bugula neritina]|uniref:Uncharacterized protein n=1 Tax=Bugula neritina TaxID=10212 RepID=A0A7J7K2F8_BUGNE|nr:hypothetical protein EB796_008877 [Bugula neritina]